MEQDHLNLSMQEYSEIRKIRIKISIRFSCFNIYWNKFFEQKKTLLITVEGKEVVAAKDSLGYTQTARFFLVENCIIS